MLGAEDRSGFLLGATVTEFSGGKLAGFNFREGGTARLTGGLQKKYKYQLSNEKKPVCLKNVGDEILPSYIGIIS